MRKNKKPAGGTAGLFKEKESRCFFNILIPCPLQAPSSPCEYCQRGERRGRPFMFCALTGEPLLPRRARA